MKKIAIIGCGGRIQGLLNYVKDSCVISAVTDVRKEAIKKELREKDIDISKIEFFEDADKMLESSDYDGVMIGTRCNLHTEMALKVLPKGIPVFLEKPVSTNMEDLMKLRDAHMKYNSNTVVSFPLRVTSHVNLVKEIIDSGKIGTVEHAQAVNNVAYGTCYYHMWYRDENITQGLFLQKATHDFDYINHILGIKPVYVCAMKSKQIFKGSKKAGLECDVCNEAATCPESPRNLKKASEPVYGKYCCFAEDTGDEDSGSAVIEYETGMHVCYSQNFFVKKKAGKRGARFMGYKGTVEFDWATDEIKVFMHNTPRTEVYKIETSGGGHAGGDPALLENFVEMMDNKSTASVAPLDAGLLSVLMCLKAKESANTRTFQKIEWLD